MKRLNILLLTLVTALCLGGTAFGTILVGRITHVQGQIYRYMDVDQSWVETFLDSPAGIQDVLTTGVDAKAEIEFPNGIITRLAQSTQVEIIQLRDNSGVFSLQNGLARFYNQNGKGNILVETGRGTVSIEPESSVDIKSANGDVIVAAVYGQATFQSDENGVVSQETISGNSSLTFLAESIVAGLGPIDRNWDRWCSDRDAALAQNRAAHSEYLPETMQQYAYALEPYGNWHRIYYRGYYYWAWQPRFVAVGWAPYTTGYWYDWQDEPVWIDYNPWGWVTHHHGNWLRLNDAWMWTPYVHISNVPGVSVVGFTIQFGKNYRPYWHPGRVRWISESSHIGWLPLAPRETYYGHRHWGPKSVVMPGNVNSGIKLNLANHSYIDYAVIIPRQDFQRRRPVVKEHYNNIRVRNIDKTVIIRNYQPRPLAENRSVRHIPTRITETERRSKVTATPPVKRNVRSQAPFRPITTLDKKPVRLSKQAKTLRRTVNSAPEQTAVGNFAGTGKKRKAFTRTERKTQQKAVPVKVLTRVKQTESHQKTVADTNPQPQVRIGKSARTTEKILSRTKVTRQAVIKERNIAGQNNSRKQIGKQAGLKNRQNAQVVARPRRTDDKQADLASNNEKNDQEEQKEQQRSSYKRAKRGDYNRQGRQPRGNFSASFKDSMLR
jgi:Family of unknown function (DUF6600)/FecR protein